MARCHFRRRAGNENLGCLRKFLGHDRALDHLIAVFLRNPYHGPARDAVKEAVRRRRVNFAVLEFVRRQMNNVVSHSRYADVINRNFGAGMDFLF